MKKNVLRSAAENDLEEIWHFIAIERFNPSAATRLIDDIEEGFLMLADTPLAGVSREEYGSGIRLFSLRHYNILYRPDSSIIEIIRILHGARDIPTEIS